MRRLVVVAVVALWFALGLAQPAEALTPHSCKAHFSTGPVASWDSNGRTMTLVRSFSFVDFNCRAWEVPKGAAVDGASIPQFLWSLMGGPFEGPYRDASVVHDWYCSRRTETWEAVDRMFYDGMIVAGVPKWKAGAFYWAVLKAGPHWDDLTIRNNRLATELGPSRGHNAAQYSARVFDQKITKNDVLRVERLARSKNLGPEDIEDLALIPR
jgi:hypothetical protein